MNESELNMSFDPDDPAIVLRFSYEYLTAAQLATIIGAVDRLYESVARLLIYDSFEYVGAPNVVIHGVPLAVTRADTSQSIDLEFKLTKKPFPFLFESDDGKIGVAIPQWVAVVAVTGSLLMGGLEVCDKALDVLIKHKELQLKTIELVEKGRQGLGQQSAASARIQSHVHEFRSAALAKNIRSATVNGVSIKTVGREKPKG